VYRRERASGRGWAVLWGLMLLLGALLVGGYALVQVRLGNLSMQRMLGGATPVPTPTAAPTRDLRGIIDEGDRLYKKGDYRGAISIYEQFLRRQPNDNEVTAKIARLLVYSGQPLRAEQRLARALQVDPNSSITRGTLCLALNFQAKLTEAVRECGTALAGDRANALVMAWLAEAQMDVGETRSARENISRALALEPKHEEVLRVAGYIEEEQRNYLKAQEYYGEALDVGAFPHVQLALGRTYAAEGRYSNAVLRFQRAIELDPAYFEAWERLGTSLWLRVGRDRVNEEAVAAFEQAIKLDPNRFQPYVRRAGYYSAVNQFEKAVEDYGNAVRLSDVQNRKLSVTDYQEFARNLARQGRCGESNAMYQRAIAGASGDQKYIADIQALMARCR
jgi:tetratricopeptide (TPR) repeat protein